MANYRVSEEIFRNILLLGESGVGKSTWINGLYNYSRFGTFENAKASEIQPLIPINFTMTDDNYDEIKIKIGSDSNEQYQEGQSSTQSPKLYRIKLNETTCLQIIDTPGIGDTRGIQKDQENFESTMKFISSVDTLHAICILLKPNNARLTVMFEFCMKQLLTHLHRDACKNIVFCFTHSRNTFYQPGDTMPALRRLLHEYNGQGSCNISLDMNTIYCIDNEAVRYLAAVQHPRVSFNDREEKSFAQSWVKSASETERLLAHIATIKPHLVAKTVSLNEVKSVLSKLGNALVDLLISIQREIVSIRKWETRSTNQLGQIQNELNQFYTAKQLIVKTCAVLSWFCRCNSIVMSTDVFTNVIESQRNTELLKEYEETVNTIKNNRNIDNYEVLILNEVGEALEKLQEMRVMPNHVNGILKMFNDATNQNRGFRPEARSPSVFVFPPQDKMKFVAPNRRQQSTSEAYKDEIDMQNGTYQNGNQVPIQPRNQKQPTTGSRYDNKILDPRTYEARINQTYQQSPTMKNTLPYTQDFENYNQPKQRREATVPIVEIRTNLQQPYHNEDLRNSVYQQGNQNMYQKQDYNQNVRYPAEGRIFPTYQNEEPRQEYKSHPVRVQQYDDNDDVYQNQFSRDGVNKSERLKSQRERQQDWRQLSQRERNRRNIYYPEDMNELPQRNDRDFHNTQVREPSYQHRRTVNQGYSADNQYRDNPNQTSGVPTTRQFEFQPYPTRAPNHPVQAYQNDRDKLASNQMPYQYRQHQQALYPINQMTNYPNYEQQKQVTPAFQNQPSRYANDPTQFVSGQPQQNYSSRNSAYPTQNRAPAYQKYQQPNHQNYVAPGVPQQSYKPSDPVYPNSRTNANAYPYQAAVKPTQGNPYIPTEQRNTTYQNQSVREPNPNSRGYGAPPRNEAKPTSIPPPPPATEQSQQPNEVPDDKTTKKKKKKSACTIS